MAKYLGKRGDLTWGKYDYPVTRTQKQALDGIWYMMSGLPKAYKGSGLPEGGFCSQRPDTGDVVIGLHHQSVSVHRSGRITSNQRSTRPIGDVFDVQPRRRSAHHRSVSG